MRDKGISEVVGEMLLLAMVVILVAVLSANVSNMMPSFEENPYATFVGSNGSNQIRIIHEGGEPIPLNKLRVIIDNGTVVASCIFSGSDLFYGNELLGGLNDLNNNSCWDFGEVLKINRTGKLRITIAHERRVLCKIFFGW